VFFEELGMRRPDVSLEVGSGKHGAQTARILERMEATLEQGPAGGGRFDRLVVVGDVNSTLAAALAAAKLLIPVAHVEAGLRSFDRTMPEETNRIVTDAISDMLLVSEPAGIENLRREGRPAEAMHLVGNVMIDTLRHLLPVAQGQDVLQRLGVEPSAFGFVTLHRPSNVDDPVTLSRLLSVLNECAQKLPLIFPVHPRTRSKLEGFRLSEAAGPSGGLRLVEPLGYLDCLALTSQAKVIVTDSGGLQEESTALGVPCLTLRENTERPVTVDEGTSTLIGNDAVKLERCLAQVLDGRYPAGKCPDLWDGRAAERIAAILAK
jgi:UDP-N-acetylglucosamine 2-epimerase (non-hydrolysing)